MFTNLKRFAVGALLATVLFAASAFGDSTVSGTITDPNSNTWAYAGCQFTLIPGPGGINPGGGGQTTAPQSCTLSSAGAFSGVVLGVNSLIGGGSRWGFVITPQNGQAAWGGYITITSASSSLSTAMSAFSPIEIFYPASGTIAGNTSLTYAAYTYTATWGATTGSSVNPFTLTDTTGNTGTGYLAAFTTTAASALGGFQVTCGAQASSATPATPPTCVNFVSGAGGVSTSAGTAGSNGGVISFNTGAGGAGASTGTGGNGGEHDILSGVGGAAAGAGGVGGNGGLIKILSGAGGGTITGGVGGAITVTAGNGANGSTAGGAGGAITITAGNGGTGGTPAGGIITLVPGLPTSTGATGKVLIAGAAAAAHLSATQTTAPAATGTCTTPAVTGTDMAGTIGASSCTTAQTIIATFNKTWGTAPVCTITPANVATAVNSSVTAVPYETVAATTLTVVSATGVTITSPLWNYTCVGQQ